MTKSDTAAQLESLIIELRDYADRGNALAKQHDVVFAILRSESKVANSCADKIEAALRMAPADILPEQRSMTPEESANLAGFYRKQRVAGSTEQVAELSANEAQRRSFVHGNCSIENPNVTREIVNQEADVEKLRERNGTA